MGTRKKSKKRGPEADRVKIDVTWKDAVKTALKKPRPEQGWPMDKKPKE